MKSLIAGALAAASFSASFVASVETKVEKPVQQIVAPVRAVTQPVIYDVFGKPTAPAVETADKVVVISSPSCPPCRRLEPIIMQLAREGYNATVEMVKEYKGPEKISATPTLLFYNGERLVKKMVGFQERETITKILQKPTVAINNG